MRSASATSGSSTDRRSGTTGRSDRGVRVAHGAHRLGRPEAPWHHVLRPADAAGRRRGSSDQADERLRELQRGVHLRRTHPADYVVGEINDGWRVGLTTLAYERVGIGTHLQRRRRRQAKGRTAREAAEEAVGIPARRTSGTRSGWDVPTWSSRTRKRRDDRVRSRSPSEDRVRAVARPLEKWTQQRARAARAAGGKPGPEGSIGEARSLSHIAQAAAETHSAIAGADRTACRSRRSARRHGTPRSRCRSPRSRSPAAPTRSS